MLPEANSKTAEVCMNIFKQGLPQVELDKELAYVAIQEEHGFNNLVPQRVPIMPYSYDSFQKMDDENRKQFLFKNPNYFKDGEGWSYLDQRSKAECQTLSNREWLVKIAGIFEKIGDVKSSQKVNNRLLMFR